MMRMWLKLLFLGFSTFLISKAEFATPSKQVEELSHQTYLSENPKSFWNYSNKNITFNLPFSNVNLSDGSLRLVGGRTPYEGRIEIYYKGTWGTICGKGFGQNEADVVCRQLGYEKADFCCSDYSIGQGIIWLYWIACPTGRESHILECNHSNWGHNFYCTCPHTEDIGVTCIGYDYCASNPCGINATCYNKANDYICRCKDGGFKKNCSEVIIPGAVRIVESLDRIFGTVQIYSGTSWSKICWSSVHRLNDAAKHQIQQAIAKSVGQKICEIGIRYDDLRPSIEPYVNIPYICIADGDLDILSKCLPWQEGILTSYCATRNSIYAVCSDTACLSNPCVNGHCTNANVNDTAYVCKCAVGYTGRNCDIEIDHCKRYQNLCDNNATCIEIGSSFRCACPPGYDGSHCQYGPYADGSIRLIKLKSGGYQSSETFSHVATSRGYPVIYFKRQWFSICYDNFRITEAIVACKQLGYDTALSYGYQGEDPVYKTSLWYDPVALQRIHCNGNESQLLECGDVKWDFCFRNQITELNCGSCPPNCTCRENLIICVGKEITEIPETAGLTYDYCHILKLRFTSVKVIKDDSFRAYPNVNKLFLDHNDIVSISNNAFQRLPVVEYITLAFNPLTNTSGRAFSNLPKLSILELANTSFSIQETIFNVPALARLHLQMMRLKYYDERITRNMRRLNKLYLDENAIVCLHHDEFFHLKKLQILSLRTNQIWNIHRYALNGLKELTTLKLGGNRISNIDGNIFHTAPKLQLIGLHKNRFKEIGYLTFYNSSSIHSIYGCLFISINQF